MKFGKRLLGPLGLRKLDDANPNWNSAGGKTFDVRSRPSMAPLDTRNLIVLNRIIGIIARCDRNAVALENSEQIVGYPGQIRKQLDTELF
jgi:hypothetical protein